MDDLDAASLQLLENLIRVVSRNPDPELRQLLLSSALQAVQQLEQPSQHPRFSN
jgi:hypothetical protein